VMLAGPTPGAEFPLDRERLTIGRAEDAGISVNHNSVSRLHCEVHALGDGRFEIVDKGSSNGVRVNGADLRRGIIEPGDLIELGDVRFKFVGAGQIFRPAEGQPLAVIADRTPCTSLRGRRGAHMLPMAVFALVVAAGAVGAWLSVRPRMRATAPPAPTASPEQAALADATRLCRAGDCEEAHARLDVAIPEGSRWRETLEFKEIESQWAESLMHRADTTSDVAAKRALYQRVAQTIEVDAAHRKTAADRLQQLDISLAAIPPTNAFELPVASTSPSAGTPGRAREDGGTISMRESTREATRKAAAPPSEIGAPSTAVSNLPPAAPVNAEERERQLALQGTPDARWTLKQQLETRVYTGKASEAEIRLLISTCKDLGDKSCVQQARAVLTQRSQ
jgi:ABC transport system ATP-binding/permease protein